MADEIADKIQVIADKAIEQFSNETGLDKEDHEAVWRNRTKMAWVALMSIIIPTLYIILRISNPDLIEKLGVLMSWYYLSLASIIGAFFGFHAWATIKGK